MHEQASSPDVRKICHKCIDVVSFLTISCHITLTDRRHKEGG